MVHEMWVINKRACVRVPVVTPRPTGSLKTTSDRETLPSPPPGSPWTPMKSGSFPRPLPRRPPSSAASTGDWFITHTHICFTAPTLVNISTPYGRRSESGAGSSPDSQDSQHQLNICSSSTRRRREPAGEAGGCVSIGVMKTHVRWI